MKGDLHHRGILPCSMPGKRPASNGQSYPHLV
jgi:hypothetical protein